MLGDDIHLTAPLSLASVYAIAELGKPNTVCFG